MTLVTGHRNIALVVVDESFYPRINLYFFCCYLGRSFDHIVIIGEFCIALSESEYNFYSYQENISLSALKTFLS